MKRSGRGKVKYEAFIMQCIVLKVKELNKG